jgi:hypothetical protein
MSLANVEPERAQHKDLEIYFGQFRRQIIGHHYPVQTPYGERKLVYADWVASGRLYRPIEERLLSEFGPLVGNTHSESSDGGPERRVRERPASYGICNPASRL